MEKNLRRGLSLGSLDPAAKTFPGLPELALLRIIGSLWPTSDMNHAVVSPARLLMGAYLGLSRVRSLQDVASGLFLCTLWLQYEQLSKRFVPEAVNFAVNAILHLAPHGMKNPSEVPGSFPCPDLGSERCRSFAINLKKAKKIHITLRKPDLIAILTGDVQEEETKTELLAVALEVLSRLSEMYKGLDGFAELFKPIFTILESIRAEKLPQALKVRANFLKRCFIFLIKSTDACNRSP
jgi:nucleolar protein 14